MDLDQPQGEPEPSPLALVDPTQPSPPPSPGGARRLHGTQRFSGPLQLSVVENQGHVSFPHFQRGPKSGSSTAFHTPEGTPLPRQTTFTAEEEVFMTSQWDDDEWEGYINSKMDSLKNEIAKRCSEEFAKWHSDISARCQTEFTTLKNELAQSCSVEFQKVAEKTTTLHQQITNTFTQLAELHQKVSLAFGEVKETLEIVKSEMVQKCACRSDENKKQLFDLQSRLDSISLGQQKIEAALFRDFQVLHSRINEIESSLADQRVFDNSSRVPFLAESLQLLQKQCQQPPITAAQGQPCPALWLGEGQARKAASQQLPEPIQQNPDDGCPMTAWAAEVQSSKPKQQPNPLHANAHGIMACNAPVTSPPVVNAISIGKLRLGNPAPAQSSPQSSFLTPLMLASAGMSLPPKYSGKRADWVGWREKWETWVATMARGDGTDDPLIFAHLMKVLDDGEAANLQRLRKENPSLSFSTFWKQLCAEKEQFISGNLRQALENLRLDNRGKMTLSRCKEYTSNFMRLASDLPEISSDEAFRLIIRQIPHYLAQSLQGEYQKRRKNFKVCISGVPTVEIKDAQDLILGLLNCLPKGIKKRGGQIFVEVSNLEQQNILLDLNGQTIVDHGLISAVPLLEGMTYKECMEFILSKVESDEELEDNRRILGGGSTFAVEGQKNNRSSKKNEAPKFPFPNGQNGENQSAPPSQNVQPPFVNPPAIPLLPKQPDTPAENPKPYYPFKSSPAKSFGKGQNKGGGKGKGKGMPWGGRGKGMGGSVSEVSSQNTPGSSQDHQ